MRMYKHVRVRRGPGKAAEAKTVAAPKKKTTAAPNKKAATSLKKAAVTGIPPEPEDFQKEVTPDQSSQEPKLKPKTEELILSPVKKLPTPITSPTRLNAKRALFQGAKDAPSTSSEISTEAVVESLKKESARRRLVASPGRPLALSPLKKPRNISPEQFLSPVKKPAALKPLPSAQLDDEEEAGPSGISFVSPVKKTQAELTGDAFAGDTNKYKNLDKLTAEVRISSRIPIPKKFEHLYNAFKRMEQIVSISMSMGKRILFDQVRSEVGKLLKRQFSLDHLAQIVHLYPESYTVRLEKKDRRYHVETTHPSGSSLYEYVLVPNLKNDMEGLIRVDLPEDTRPLPLVSPTKLVSPVKGRVTRSTYIRPPSPKKSPVKVMIPQPREAVLDARARLEAWRQQCRLYIFKHRIIGHVKKTYKVFLEKQDIEVEDADLAELRRFDGEFEPESTEEVPLAPLPQIPKSKNTYEEFRKTLDEKNPSELSSVKDILKDIPIPGTSKAQNGDPAPAAPPKKMSLMERIRAKEAAKKNSEAANVDKEAQRLRRARLEDIIKTNNLHNMDRAFSSKNRSILPVQDIVKVLVSAYKTTSEEILKRLDLLVEIAKDRLEYTISGGVKKLKKKGAGGLVDLTEVINAEIKKISSL
ncbi:hypothetical protein L596_008428 [Steinernema carpocapsae]|uniref:CDT1 Geminin-binding domain-containing protein n=2 Tax=Steinernema carpocapsae TaxID=34508 RepID=A0A4V6A6A7_STECR|nr:hypothetical protein L596_008428 [Steinernema carpocapsae]